MEEKTVCNRENKSQSDLWNRKCWIADSLASLIQSHVEYLAEKYAPELNADTDPGSPLWKLTKELDYYCEELRVRNGLRHARRSEQAGGRGVVELERGRYLKWPSVSLSLMAME